MVSISSRQHALWIFGVAAAIGVTLAGMFAWMSWHSRDIVIRDTYVASANLARSVEQFVARTLETIDLSLQIAGAELAEHGQKPRQIPALLARRLKESPQITALVFVGADGRIRYSTVPGGQAGADVSGNSYFTQAHSSERTQITFGDLFAPHAARQHAIIASRPVRLADGRFAGVVAASLNPDYVQRFFSTLNIGSDGIIAVNTHDGTLLLRRPYIESLIGNNFAPSALFQDWLPVAAAATFQMRYKADDLWRIVGYQRVGQWPLVAQVALSKDEALANWQRTTMAQAAVGIALLITFAVMAVVLNNELQARLAAHADLGRTVDALEGARLAAEESSRVKSQFMAHMSHELRTPLNAIIGFSEVIRDAVMGPVEGRYRGYARDIHSSGQHLLRLINDILDLSKVEGGHLDLHEEPVDVGRLFADCHRLLADRIRAGQVEFVAELPPDLPKLRADELRLKQITLNLLSNAVKFTAAGGRIVLAAALAEDGGMVLAVHDNGIGMSPDDIPIALEPFRQVDGAFNRRFEGTGLGLPLARRLAELHGGSLAITSTVGRGTSVAVRFPPERTIIAADPGRDKVIRLVAKS